MIVFWEVHRTMCFTAMQIVINSRAREDGISSMVVMVMIFSLVVQVEIF